MGREQVGSEKVIEGYLEKIASGQKEYLSDLLLHLSEEILYTPVVAIQNAGDAQGTKKIKVATFSSEGRSIVPTFTSEEYFLEWSDGKHQCFSVSGGDLALSLPRNTWLVINPGYSSSYELSPDQISVVAEADRFSRKSGIACAEAFEPEGRRATRTDLRTGLFSDQALQPAGSETRAEGENETFPFVSEQVCTDLSSVLKDYQEIDEAYFEATLGGSSQAELGILAQQLSAERRFVLIDEIAEISRKYYGSAGAIEVYDDLNIKSSRSWELFSAIAPFYSKNRGEETTDAAPSELRSHLTIERIRAKRVNTDIEPAPEEEEEVPSSAWEELRKKSSKLFGSFRFNGRE
jgi:hypothetical protein